jgi:hypothetical protein
MPAPISPPARHPLIACGTEILVHLHFQELLHQPANYALQESRVVEQELLPARFPSSIIALVTCGHSSLLY